MNKINFLIGLSACFLMSSCDDYLDRTPDDKVTEKQVFTSYDKVDGLVTKLYEDARSASHPLVYFSHFGTAPATDECTASAHEGAIPRQFQIGNWGPVQGMPGSAGQYWWDLYSKIRKANVILEGVAKYNTPDNPREGKTGDINKRIGETFFLRGYLYYILVKQYGEVPYLDHTILPSDDMAFTKVSVHELVEKICADADSAYNRVNSICPDGEFGRVDKGACLGLKAMVRWLAATPLWNGGKLPDDTRIFKEEYTYDKSRWEKAKNAASAVINFQDPKGGSRYKLYDRYSKDDFTDSQNRDGVLGSNKMVQRRLWDMYYDPESIKNEWVWFTTRGKDSPWAGDNLPPSMDGHARQRPIQEQVDEYEIIINGYGYPIYSDKAKGVYDDGNPYVNRDPRFYRDIVYHGSTFRDKVINTAEGKDVVGSSYQANSSHSGYYLRKYIKEGWDKSGYNIHGPALFRLTTIMYIYCEAVNELTGPNQEIYDMINSIRTRSFMAPMPPEVKSDKALMNDYIQRERRVELFYENDRIWRCRLYLEPDNAAELAKEKAYKDANSWPYAKTQRNSHGMKPIEDSNGKIVVDGKKYKMVRFNMNEERAFNSPRHYLFPIMDDEMKRCPSLVQNPGW